VVALQQTSAPSLSRLEKKMKLVFFFVDKMELGSKDPIYLFAQA